MSYSRIFSRTTATISFSKSSNNSRTVRIPNLFVPSWSMLTASSIASDSIACSSSKIPKLSSNSTLNYTTMKTIKWKSINSWEKYRLNSSLRSRTENNPFPFLFSLTRKLVVLSIHKCYAYFLIISLFHTSYLICLQQKAFIRLLFFHSYFNLNINSYLSSQIHLFFRTEYISNYLTFSSIRIHSSFAPPLF